MEPSITFFPATNNIIEISSDTSMMNEADIYQWLSSQGITVPQYQVFNLNDQLYSNDYPVVLKIVSPAVIHKSDVGGVITGIQNDEQLQVARQKLISNLLLHKISPEPLRDKLLVSRQYQGIELFFGIVQDAVFGKVIVFGSGGIFTELIKDVCFIDSEADEEEIVHAILQTKISLLFTSGFRGKRYDIQLVTNFIKKLQQLDVKEMDLNPVILSNDELIVVDARILMASDREEGRTIKYIPELFSPHQVAIIGVSRHAEKIGYALAKNNAHLPNIHFVNPNCESLLDHKVYQKIEDLPFIDTAVLAIPACKIEESIIKLAAKNVKNVIVISAGFKEAGQKEDFLEKLAKKYQLNIIGPNCLGVIINEFNLTFASTTIQKGTINFFSQSGSIVAEFIDKAAARNIGFESIVSVGNMADVDFADLIASYPGNNPIHLYIEGIRNGKNFLRALRKVKVPVKIFKAGKTAAAQKAAFSHTGNLAGDYQLFAGLMKNTKAQFLTNVNGLLYPYRFEKILIVTNAGGAGTLMADCIGNKLLPLSTHQITKLNEVLPPHWSKNNPIDIIGDATVERYLKTLQIADSFNADVIYVIITPQFMTNTLDICKLFTSNNFQTKLFPVLLGGESVQIAKNYLKTSKLTFFEEIEEAVSFV